MAKHKQNDYTPTEKFIKLQKELEATYNAKFESIKKEVPSNWAVEYKNIWSEWKSNVESTLFGLLENSLSTPTDRKFKGVDIKKSYDDFVLSIETGWIMYTSLSTVINLVSDGLSRMSFGAGDYVKFLVDVLDPINDYCNEQYKLIEAKIKEESTALMAEWKKENDVLQSEDFEHYKNQKTNKLTVK